MKPIDKRKVIGTVIGLIFFISCLVYFTYAWYEWRSGNNTVNLTIKDSSVECTNGPSIEVKNIGPILSLKDGVKANFNIKNTGGEEINITLGLNITSISSSLRTDSFKWALLQDTTGTNNFDYSKTPLLSGNFSNLGIKENTLSSTIKVAGNKTYSFMFVVYIDGNMENSESMMSGSMKTTITYGDCGTTTTKQYLNTVSPGSYIKYTGTNGCSGKSCEGQNANYVSNTDMGYCYSSSYKFNSNGWRVVYINDGTAYLTSGGSPECMCTDSSGNASTSCSDYEKTPGIPKHLANLNAKALTYCNSTYAYGDICNNSSAWNMSDGDFQKITGDTISTAYNNAADYYDDNPIINNGGYYWFATPYSTSSTNTFYWLPVNRRVYDNVSYRTNGVRPVLRLKSSVIVTGGTGTYEDPYTISSGKTKLSEVAPGSYVKYTGTNGCSGKSCEGQNANYVDSSDMGYCYSSDDKFNASGWRVAYINDGTAYLTSGGSPECMCTDSSGNASTSCSSYETTGGAPKHLANLNTKSLTYCNSTYAYGGICNNSSAWNMSDGDFQKITGDTISTAYNNAADYYDDNPIINNGGYYWFATPYSTSSTNTFYWLPVNRRVYDNVSYRTNGVRPVLRLKSSVIVTGGTGTYEDPYTISPDSTK